MALEDYRRKRNFSRTPEPSGAKDHTFQSRYVIQRHDAQRLHYDLRLEMEGVLKSWAVPKGPSMNPDDKRLAVHTEDHPIQYLHFQGTIPKGNYGTGEMTIWDKGTYTSYKNPDDPENLKKEYENGTLHLLFQGHKLQGKFTLVRTKYGNSDQWLLIKQNDEYATEASYDAEDYTALNESELEAEEKVKAENKVEEKDEGGLSFSASTNPLVTKRDSTDEDKTDEEKSITLDTWIPPMLATPSGEAFNDPDWLFELKYDGYRVLANIKDHQARLYSRNGINYNDKFSEVHKELSLLSHEAILDGEMIVTDFNGHPQFQALQNYDDTTEGKLQYKVFDLLHLNGHSLLRLPLTHRKELLREMISDGEYVQYCDHVFDEGRPFYLEAVDQGLEGIIAKRKNSLYYPGRRSEDWLKIKQIQTADPIICGYTESEKTGRPFGSLILGVERDGQLYYSGNCGTGFSHDNMDELYHLFQPLIQDDNPFSEKPDLKGRVPQWLTPKLVCEIKYSEITSDGRFRHPVFLRMRPDKRRGQSEIEPPTSVPDSGSNGDHLVVNGISLTFSNLDKIYWPESGIKKYDLLEYYISVSDVMLPYLVDRPQNMHRHPDGINMPGFYQKDQEYIPEWASTVQLHSSSTGKVINYLLCQNEATLLYMVNLGCIEINPWMSTVNHIENPDYAVIDLDPSPGNTFEQVIEAALAVRKVLDRLKIEGMPKTSGSRGIHIYIPMGGNYSYEQARDFVRLICMMVRKLLPGSTTLERSLKKRGSKIYLDYLQNRRGQTVVAPYSVRPVPGARVSTPITWEELDQGFLLSDFNIYTLPSRLKKKGDLFSGLLKAQIDMMEAIATLEKSLK